MLRQSRELKMARSVHAFVRGNTAAFYDWLAASPVARSLPAGPDIWICGDCHLGNLGPIADADQRIDFQIRDLDQTVIGNPALDLIRLGLSLETAARSSDLPGVTIARMIEAMAESYAMALDTPGKARFPEPDAVRTARQRALARRWRHLAEERIEGADPTIPFGKTFWPLAEEERVAIAGLFEEPGIAARSLDLAGLSDKGRSRVIDSAYWKKGCSSLGHLRFAVLLGMREKGTKDERFAIVDIKEAVAPLAPVSKPEEMPEDDAERIVAGACALAPNLGERMIPARLLGKPVVLRELKPQDLKLEVEQFSHKQAVRASAYLAFVVGRAHARQLDAKGREKWAALFARKPDAELDAPSWLWRAVVDLAATHEGAYLQHCRNYALAA